MTALFLFGTLLDETLRTLVAGTRGETEPAVLPGQGLWRAADGDYPVLGSGDAAAGLLWRAPSDAALARLHFYEEGFGYVPQPVEVRANDGIVQAVVYRRAEPAPPGDEPWSLAEWQRDWAAMTRRAAREVMSLHGTIDGRRLRAIMPMIRVRADAALRAEAAPAARNLRTPHARSDVELIEARRPYTGFFALDESDLTHLQFDGTRSGTLTRAGLISGDAVTVLPYDPVRDRVLLVEQFRFGPWMRGDPVPWSLEPVAGRIDPGETPEQAARRETREEAGLALHELVPVAASYPSPGCLSEYLFSYVGLCDLPDPTPGAGGLNHEGEDIRTHTIPFPALMDLVDSGEADNTPLLMTAFWLERQRAGGRFTADPPA